MFDTPWQHSFDECDTLCEGLQEGFKRVQKNIFSAHHHDYYELFIIENGQAVLDAECGIYNIEQGGIYLIPPGTIHSWHHSPEITGYIMRIPVGGLEQISLSRNIINLHRCNEEIVTLDSGRCQLDLIIMLVSWFQLEQKSGNQQQLCNLYLATILREIIARCGSPNDGYPNHRELRLSTRFRALMETRFTENLSIDAYTYDLNTTRAQLDKTLRKVTGKTPATWLRERRLNEAKRLIQHTSLTISQISDQIGYPNQAYFSRVFKRSVGLTAIQFRKYGH